MRHVSILAIACSLALTACNQSTAANGNSSSGDQAPLPTPTPSVGQVTVGKNDGSPNFAPAPLISEAERGKKGARDVLLSFARAIELREFDQAWEMLDERDQTKWSKTQWRAVFADLRNISVVVTGGSMEGAAGSSYYTSEAAISAASKDGRPIRYNGPIVLRRVNDVPGASAKQLRWHIDSVQFDWTH